LVTPNTTMTYRLAPDEPGRPQHQKDGVDLMLPIPVSRIAM